ncbi:pentatricopeptide repeat-containing protein At1g55890, mitochondrial-like [Solanum dulcamara]|uniref:pentatricopeptide repeat-containing protein At1g55890, mitochondrial-like n=1 Tax=Solanum dulcamara TaxID=45834 RepID=UPI002485433E|nr:pentatricopeptide repeat-containing protein At1g55890, mitochondrial-like [Solanum dulcamara]
MSSSSTLYRRLHGIFAGNHKVTVKLKNENPKTTSLKSTKPKPELPEKQELQIIVDNFKKSSESPIFRNRYTNYRTAIRRLEYNSSFIEDIFEHQKQYPEISNEFFVCRLILLYGTAKMHEHARKLFDEMPNLKCQRTVFSFNALLEAYSRAEKYDIIRELFQELPEELSIEPDVVSYNTLIKALWKAGSLDSAVSVMDEMEKQGIIPDKVTFNTLLNAYYESKRFSEAEDLWVLMRKKNVVADLGSYTVRLRGLVGSNQVNEAIELFEEMGKKDIIPKAFNYNIMIKMYVDDRNWEEAKRWYVKMMENGRYPDNATFEMLISFACDKDNLDFALELCKKSIDSKVSIYNATMQRVVNVLAEHSKLEDAKELVNLAKAFKLSQSRPRPRYKLWLPSLQ